MSANNTNNEYKSWAQIMKNFCNKVIFLKMCTKIGRKSRLWGSSIFLTFGSILPMIAQKTACTTQKMSSEHPKKKRRHSFNTYLSVEKRLGHIRWILFAIKSFPKNVHKSVHKKKVPCKGLQICRVSSCRAKLSCF